MSTLRRFSYSAGRDQPLEASAAWAAEHDFGAVEFNADLPPNSPDQWDDTRVLLPSTSYARSTVWPPASTPRRR